MTPVEVPVAPTGDTTAAGPDLRLVPAALTSWLVTAAGIEWPATAGPAAIAGALLVIGGLACRVRVRALTAGLVALGVVTAGFAAAIGFRDAAIDRHPFTALVGADRTVTVTATESAVRVGSTRLMFRATLLRVEDTPVTGRVVVFTSTRTFGTVMVGQPVTFRAHITEPTRRDLTVAVLNAVGPPSRGRAGPLHRAAHGVRCRFTAASRTALPGEQAALLPALVLGDTTALSGTADREFKAAGLTHLMAVSGANVTVVCGAVLLSAWLIGPRAAVLLAATALLAFVIVVQPTASVLRAAVMGAIALAGVLSSRRRQAIPSLAASVLVLIVFAPQLAVDVGFALSVVATAALVVVAPVWSRHLVGRRWPKPLADAVAIAAAAQLVTAPLIAGISGRVSVVSAAANLAVAALIAPITVLGSAAAALSGPCPVAAEVLIRFTGPAVWWVRAVAHWAGGLPGATVPVPAGAGGVALVAALTVAAVAGWRWRWCRVMLAACGLLLLSWTLSGVLGGG